MQWQFGQFYLDLDNACLWRGDERVDLRPKPFDLLVYLVEHAGELVSKDELLEAVWPETVVADSALTVGISELRKVLGESVGVPQFIATVHRRGYRFIAPVSASPVSPVTREQPQPGMPAMLPAMLHMAPPPYLVSREAELDQMYQQLRAAQDGQRQLLFITGEAGIGKTTLVDVFVHQVMQDGEAVVTRGQCLDQYGMGEAYLPLLEALGLLLRGPQGDQLVAQLKQEAPSWLLQLPTFVPEAEFDLLQRRASGVTRERMLRELAELIETLTAERPLVLVIEDLHWSDRSTLDWLTYVARRRQPARLFILGTYRPADALVQNHPVREVAQELIGRGYGLELALDYLSEADVATYLQLRIESDAVPHELVQRLYDRTSGNPLFLRSLVDALQRQSMTPTGGVRDRHEINLGTVEIEPPAGLQQLISLQLEQLTPGEQELLEVASVAGREFGTEAVAACLSDGVEGVEDQFSAWARGEQFVQSCGVDEWPDGTLSMRFVFIHDLYREIAYERSAMSRRMRWHRQIGARLEAGYGDQTYRIATELAMHFSRGRDVPKAVHYLYKSGASARQRSAYQEAITHLTEGLERLRTLPDTPERAQQELGFCVNLAMALVALRGQGASEVERVFARARELCQQMGETPQLFPVLWGLLRFYFARAQFGITRDLADQLMRLALRTQDSGFLLEAHRGLGVTLFCLGELSSVRHHMTQSLSLYDAAQHGSHAWLYGQDPSVVCRCFLAWTMWILGYPDQALKMSEETLKDAQTLSHLDSLAYALNAAAAVHQLRGEPQLTRLQAEAAIELSTEQHFAYHGALGAMLYGWGQGMQGELEKGSELLEQGLANYRATGAEVLCSYYLCLLAEVHGQGGQPETGLKVLDEAWELMNKTEERFYEAERHRLRGELLLQVSRDNQTEAESAFNRSLMMAQRQDAKSLELRAAMSLARLWQSQGKSEKAYELLAPVYEWFTEGFDTADLQDADALLTELSA